MLESLVITLREGIEAALAVGIILVYLKQSGRENLAGFVYSGLAAAVIASLAGAFALSKLPLNEEITEGALMIAAAVMVLTMVAWMAHHGRRLKGQIEAKVGRLVSRDARAAAAAGVFAFAFLMVFREGMETVLLLAAVNLTSDALLAFVGGVTGIALAVLFGVAFVKGSVLVDLGRFFKITGLVLCVFAAQLLLGGAHELAEGGILPLGRREMQIVGPVVRAQALFIAALLAIPLLLLLIPGRGRAVPPERTSPPGRTLSAPERRKLLAKARTERLWRVLACSAGLLVIVSLTGSYAYTRLPRQVDPPAILRPSSDELRLPVAGLDDGHLHRFGVLVEGTAVRFLVMKGEAGRLATSFDACQICGGAGYIEEKGRLVCITCAADIAPATIGFGGGCNPIPLASRQQGQEIRVSMADLQAMAPVFREAASRAK